MPPTPERAVVCRVLTVGGGRGREPSMLPASQSPAHQKGRLGRGLSRIPSPGLRPGGSGRRESGPCLIDDLAKLAYHFIELTVTQLQNDEKRLQMAHNYALPTPRSAPAFPPHQPTSESRSA